MPWKVGSASATVEAFLLLLIVIIVMILSLWKKFILLFSTGTQGEGISGRHSFKESNYFQIHQNNMKENRKKFQSNKKLWFKIKTDTVRDWHNLHYCFLLSYQVFQNRKYCIIKINVCYIREEKVNWRYVQFSQ